MLAAGMRPLSNLVRREHSLKVSLSGQPPHLQFKSLNIHLQRCIGSTRQVSRSSGTGYATRSVAVASSQVTVVDGNTFLFRFHHANRARLTNSQGKDTTVAHHMLSYLLKLVATDISHAVVVFDGPGPPSRRDIYPPYKGNRNRDAIPVEIVEATQQLPRLLNRIGILSIALPFTEADDIIATLARRCCDAGNTLHIHSNDKDFYQLLKKDKVTICRPDDHCVTNETFEEKFEFDSSLFTNYQALAGDASDCVPGIPKIGHKRATQLVQQYGTLESIYSNLDGVKESAWKRNLVSHGLDYALLMRELVTLRPDIELPDLPDTPESNHWLGYLTRPDEQGGNEFMEFCQDNELTAIEKLFDKYCHHMAARELETD